MRTIAVSAITALVRRAIERRRATAAAADAAIQSTRASSTPASGVAEWAPLTTSATTPDVASSTTAPAWVEPVDGQCPISHPVKGNASSNIYHVPGSRFYDMTTPERCYLDATAAEADGMRAPKR